MKINLSKKGIRTIIFLLATIFTYILLVWQLYHNQAILYSMVFILILFFLIHFLYLDIQKVKFHYMLAGFVLISLIDILFFRLLERHLRVSVFLINASILALIESLRDETHKIQFSSWKYFAVGGYIFTVFVTIGYSLAMIGIYTQFPYSCQDLSDASYSVVDIVTQPLSLGLDEVTRWKKGITNFFNSNIGDVVGAEGSSSLITQLNDVLSDQFDSYKHIAVDQVLADNSLVNMGICEYLLVEINKRFHVPSFQFSVVVLMFLLLYGFVRIAFFVISAIALLIFKVLYMLGVYHTEQTPKDVDTII